MGASQNGLRAAVSWRGFGFTYRRRDEPALAGIDLTLEAGGALALLGRSGAGKTTLCSSVNGIVPRLLAGRAEGAVCLAGRDVTEREVPAWADTVGVLFQDFESQIFSTQVSLEVAFGPENLGLERAEILRRVGEALERTGIAGLAGRNPAHLSGGEKQRLVLASVLALEPEVLVLDEPTTDLDPAAREDVFGLVEELAREGRTCLIAEHEPRILDCCRRAAVLRGGRLERLTTAAELRGDPGWMRERGLAADPVAAVWEAAGLEAPAPADATAAGLELRRRGARLGPVLAPHAVGEVLLEARGLEVTHPGGVRALRGVDLEIREGEAVAVVGPNGAGKTTLARCLAGLLAPDRGGIRHRGRGLSRPRDAAGRVGLVMQEPDDQIFSPTVLEEVECAPLLAGVADEAARRNALDALEAVGLRGREEADPFALPKGDRQKVAVASVLATGPEVLVLDEPTTGLDATDLAGMLVLLRRLREAGRAVVMVTHSMEVAAAEADRLLVLAEGRILADAPPREIFADRALLERARLRTPPVVEICRSLDGPPALTVDELEQRLVWGRG